MGKGLIVKKIPTWVLLSFVKVIYVRNLQHRERGTGLPPRDVSFWSSRWNWSNRIENSFFFVDTAQHRWRRYNQMRNWRTEVVVPYWVKSKFTRTEYVVNFILENIAEPKNVRHEIRIFLILSFTVFNKTFLHDYLSELLELLECKI